MSEPRDLIPAEHFVPAPEGGWRGVDLTDADLVDDEYIADDPDSYVAVPDGA